MINHKLFLIRKVVFSFKYTHICPLMQVELLPCLGQVKAQKTEVAKRASADRKTPKKRQRDGLNTSEAISSHSKRQKSAGFSNIEATVVEIYDRPRLNLRRA